MSPQVRISGWYEQEHKWLCFGKLILIVGDKEELEGKIKIQGMRSFVSDEYKHDSTCSSAWTDHEARWPTCSSTRSQYYWHIHITNVHSRSNLIWENFHYYSKCTVNSVAHVVQQPSNYITVELICSQLVLTCTVFVQNWETTVQGRQINIFLED